IKMFAVIESGGKQHKVTEGDNLQVELLTGEEGSKVEFNKVLMISDGKKSKVGSPFLEKAKVIGKVVRHGKSDKIKVFKMKRRKGYRRTQGHRQSFTEVLIEKINS
ncbi:uncharacterized protein METZ01_LOCUS495486, partial [marine metagenome]